MQSIRPKDLYVYFSLFIFYCVIDNGIIHFVGFVLSNISVFFTIPYEFFCERYYLPFSLQTVVSQRSTDLEFFLIESLKYNLNCLSRKWGMAFFDARVFNTLFKIRYLREAGSGLGDVTYKKELNGIWIRSKSKGELIPDIVVVFVPGSWIVGGTVDMYLEYLSIFCVTLQQQGFRNPCIFAPNVDATEMNTVVESTYNAIGEQFGETHIVLAGDSIGATMIINSLLTSKCVRPPSTVLLISPITQFEFNDAGTSTCDYLSLSKIQSWLEFINPIRLSPGTEDWSNIPNMPTDGFIISYGSEECVVSYTEEFIKLLAENGCKLKIDRQVAQVHDWAIVNFYTETLIEHREESIHIYSTTLSRLLLSKTDSFFGVNRANIESIVTIDEERN